MYLSTEGSDDDEACAVVGAKKLCPAAAIALSPVPRLWLKSTGWAAVEAAFALQVGVKSLPPR